MSVKPEKVLKFPVEGIPNAYILVSFHRRSKKKDELIYSMQQLCSYTVSFVYDAGRTAVEWEPRNGPISILQKADELNENSQVNYFYPYIYKRWGNWSQLSVDREGLPEALFRNDFIHIFRVLREWAALYSNDNCPQEAINAEND